MIRNRTEVGGTGHDVDWQRYSAMVQVISLKHSVIVAGGLNAGNVEEAIRLLQPFGVDVSSGVEARPGKKDPEKVRAFRAGGARQRTELPANTGQAMATAKREYRVEDRSRCSEGSSARRPKLRRLGALASTAAATFRRR